ncbi:TetR family transcriptional regulator [Paenibacillus sp. 5J-6]|uniref:TetR family transcriptional regulator n=1 Tax=Paenibacillus silvestris TaxID=2606219 RepID=A0A6L8V7H2_9BACL|nr:TetR/AcrR family transcriptional regulator [Paenibacillus silvestris]MZQ85279.1 TetR family transcriptional regulator [Paenibacillus silvestris]
MDTKKQIVRLALELIREKGFLSIGYDDLAQQLGITRAAIHYHFEKKEDLGIAVTQMMIQDLIDLDTYVSSTRLTIEEKLDHFLIKQIEPFSEKQICSISSLQSDVESLPDSVKEKLQEVTKLELKVLVNIISEFKIDDVTADTEYIEELAATILSAVKGALLYRRVIGDSSLYPKVIKQIKRLLL